jgi:hypothetical protein
MRNGTVDVPPLALPLTATVVGNVLGSVGVVHRGALKVHPGGAARTAVEVVHDAEIDAKQARDTPATAATAADVVDGDGDGGGSVEHSRRSIWRLCCTRLCNPNTPCVGTESRLLRINLGVVQQQR